MSEYVIIIYDQVGIQEIIPTGIIENDEWDDDEEEPLELVNQLRDKLVRLPYETNPLPSGGMGLGSAIISTRSELERNKGTIEDFLNREYEKGYIHPSIKAALEG
tara:strand:+ start:854 stop:1168 length:315 start_codon:yes stop_codon:yes gene_type:complete